MTRGPSANHARVWAVLTVPVAVPLSMTVLFSMLAKRMSPRSAYNIGFIVYWVGWCGLFSFWVLGWRRSIHLYSAGEKVSWVERALLALPVVGGAVTQVLPHRRDIDTRVAATMLVAAAVNAPLEEMLWRGVFLEIFPDNVVLGAVWPLVGFSIWHLAPQLILPSRLGKARFTAGAATVGAVSAFTVWRRRRLRPVLWSHLATDAMGVTAARFRLGLDTRPRADRQ